MPDAPVFATEPDVITPPTDPSLATDGTYRTDASSGDVAPHDLMPFICGLGASAGGLEALIQFFSAVTPDSGISYVVVQHLSPDRKSLMVDLLGRHTSLPVSLAEDGEEPKADHVYLIPSDANLDLREGRFVVTKRDRTLINYPIDQFFGSLAKDREGEAAAVVLSGTGSDGTRGVRMIKEYGGLVMVQDPQSAQFDGMPRNAAATGLADYALEPGALAPALLRYVTHPRSPRRVVKQDAPALESDLYERIFAELRRSVGVDFAYYKMTTVVRRVAHRMTLRQIEDLEVYAHLVREDPDEAHALYRELLIGVTRFFRDRKAFEYVQYELFPQLMRRAARRPGRTLRLWVAGCSTGEEAYSLAMIAREFLDAQEPSKRFSIKIFATDLDQAALAVAGTGLYPESIAADLSSERLQRHFVKTGDHYQVARELRQMVIFAPHNLMRNPPFSKVDLIACRNVLIYFKPFAQEQVFANFAYALGEGGYLFLGPSETVGVSNGFEAVKGAHKVYRHTGSARFPLSVTPGGSRSRQAPGPDVTPPVRPGRKDSFEDFFDRMLLPYVQPAVVVDASYRVSHVFGDTARYLQVPSGRADMNLLRMVHSDLHLLLGTALHKALRDGTKVVYENVTLGEGEERIEFDLVVDPHMDSLNRVLVLFDERRMQRDEEEAQGHRYDVSEMTAQRIQDLEYRLQHTQETLQATIEELETSNEELQATNEELMASNEELQSTNEELHSVNEELITVNAELQAKIQELTEMNTDVDNLLQNTRISVIFLDAELHVRKFTDRTMEYLPLRPRDVGRPLRDLSHDLLDVNLPVLSKKALDDDDDIEQTVQDTSGRWYVLRVLPYRSVRGDIDGVVVTLQELTALRDQLLGEG